MNHTKVVRRCSVLLLLILTSNEACFGDDASLVAEFEQQRIATHRLCPLTGSPMKLDLCRFEYLDTNRGAITAEAAKAFVETAADAWAKENDVQAIVKLSQDLKLNYSPWSRGIFRQTPEGEKVRLRLGPIEPDINYPTIDHSKEGDDSTFYSSDSRQLSHYRGNTGWQLIDSNEFFPSASLSMEMSPSKDLGNGILRFQHVRGTYYDWDSTSEVFIRTYSAGGGTQEYSRYSGFTDYPNELTKSVVACPGFVSHVNIKGDMCDSLLVYLILSAEFPFSVPDSEFDIPAPVGTNAVLFAPKSMSDVAAATKIQEDRGPVADARTLVPRLLEQEEEHARLEQHYEKQEMERTGIRPWLFWMNAIGLVLVGIGFVWMKRRGKGPTNSTP